MMKTILTITGLMVLAGCNAQTNRDNWSTNCEQNYSLNSREMSECKAKVADDRKWEIGSGTISVDKNEHDPFDSIGKGGPQDILSN
jgi:hypothetical protein